MHKIAVNLTNYLITNGIAQEEVREKYIYGLEVFGLKCINYSSILILSIVMDDFIPTVFFMLNFFSLRGRTGGFHAKSAMNCYVGTLGMYIIIAQFFSAFVVKKIYIMIAILLISVVLIVLYAPLNNINLNLSKNELHNCKISTRVLLGLLVSCIVGAFFIGINLAFIAFAICGIALDASLLVLQKFVERGKRNEEGC